MATIIPTNVVQVDDRAGNHYTIFQVQHVTGVDTDIQVDNSAMSAAELPPDITVATGPVKETASAAGITITDDTTTDGLKEVTIHADVASGTYVVVVRHIGSAGGLGSSKVDN